MGFAVDLPLAIEEWDTSSEEKCGRVISPFVTQGTSQFLCASQVFPTSGGILTTTAIPTSGGFFSPQLLSHKWGKLVTRTGIGMYLE